MIPRLVLLQSSGSSVARISPAQEQASESCLYDEQDVLSELANLSQRFPQISLSTGVGAFLYRWERDSGYTLQEYGEQESWVCEAMIATLEEIGLEGEHSYRTRDSTMTLRDYLCLVPSEMLPDDYMY